MSGGPQRAGLTGAATPGLSCAVTRNQVIVLGAFLLLVELALEYLATVPFPWTSVRLRFSLDEEMTVPAWFSSTQLFVLALIAAYCTLRDRRSAESIWGNGWLILSGLFAWLSLDETVSLHELIGEWLAEHSPGTLFGQPTYYWLLPFAPLVLFAIVYLVRVFWDRFRHRPRLLAVAGVGLVAWIAAVGCEVFGAIVSRHYGRKYAPFNPYLVGWEEFLEMAGATCFLMAFLRYASTLPQQEAR